MNPSAWLSGVASLAAVTAVLAVQAVYLDDLFDMTKFFTAGFAKELVFGYWFAVAAIVGAAVLLPAKRLDLPFRVAAAIGAVPIVATLLVGRELWSAAVAVLTLCACWAAGRWTLAWLRAPVLAEFVPASWLAGVGVLGLAVLFLGRAGLLRWWTVGAAVLVLGVFGSLSLGRMLINRWEQIWQTVTGSRLAVACASLGVFGMGLASVWTAAPEMMFDALYAKAWLPREWARTGSIEPLSRHPILNITGFAQVLAVPGHLLGAPGVGRYLQWLAVVLLSAAVWWGARRSAWAPLGAVTVVLTPHLFWQATTAHDDAVLALAALSLALSVVRILNLARPLTALEAVGIGVLAGVCANLKLHLAPLAAGLALGVLLASRRPGTIAGLAAGGLAVALPPFVMRWIDLGNPVLPALNNVFRSELWRPVDEKLDMPFLSDPGPLGPLSTLGRALVDPGALSQDTAIGSFGVLAPALVAALLVLWWPPRGSARLAVWLGLLLAAVSWYMELRYLRYLVPSAVVAVTALAAAGPFTGLTRRTERGTLAAVALTAVLLWPATVAQFGNLPGRDLPWRAALGLEPDIEYERRWIPPGDALPPREAIATFDRLTPPGSLAVSDAHQRLWLTEGRDLMPRWELDVVRLLPHGEPPASSVGMLCQVRAVGVGWILASPDKNFTGPVISHGNISEDLDELAKRHSEVVWIDGGWTLYRLEECPW